MKFLILTFISVFSGATLAAEWDMVVEIESKAGLEWVKNDKCYSSKSIIDDVPHLGSSYYDYLRANVQQRTTKVLNLGKINGIEVLEIVHRFKEPIDYLKIVGYKNENDEICPFIVIGEWERQVKYSASYIRDNQVKSSLNADALQTGLVYLFSFELIQGLPIYIEKKTLR